MPRDPRAVRGKRRRRSAARLFGTEHAGHHLPFLALTLALALGCAPPEVSYEAEYFLIDHLDTAILTQEHDRPLRAPSFEIDHDQRRVLFHHPPSAARFAGVPSGPGHRLLTATAMAPKSWTNRTDGVAFEASCRGPGGASIPLLEKTLSPASRPEDRAWHDQEISLEPCSTPTTELELRTSCGEDCLNDWALWADPRVVHTKSFTPRPKRLALVISIDTLRPDRLGLYGGPRDTSPELERLAADGIVFETAVASSPWTIPSHATLLSSSYPRVHGAGDQTPIADTVSLLPEIFQRAGWQTAGFVDTPYLGRRFGFHRGFELFDDQPAPAGSYRRGAPSLRQRLQGWLAAADGRPAFAFWHIMDVHGPYGAPAPFGGSFRHQLPATGGADPRLEQLRQLAYHDYLQLDRFTSFDDLVASYDEGLAAADAEIGRLFQVLRDAGLYDDALIVVTSDHGESFLDHQLWVGHGLFLTDDEIRVPLVIKLPGNRHAGLRVPEMVGLIDLTPSVLDALGLPEHSSFQGRSLLSPAPGQAGSLPEQVYGYSSNTGAPFVRTGQLKYIGPAQLAPEDIARHHLRPREGVDAAQDLAAGEQLYHLRRDPREQTSLADDRHADHLESLRALIARHAAECDRRRQGLAPQEAAEPSPEEQERLRALGYTR